MEKNKKEAIFRLNNLLTLLGVAFRVVTRLLSATTMKERCYDRTEVYFEIEGGEGRVLLVRHCF